MDTVSTSNVTTSLQVLSPTANNNNYNYNENDDNYYAQESGGLQAIFESKLTPRHRNTISPEQQLLQREEEEEGTMKFDEQQAGLLLYQSNNNIDSSSSSQPKNYQRS